MKANDGNEYVRRCCVAYYYNLFPHIFRDCSDCMCCSCFFETYLIMKILIIEDEIKTGSYLQKAFSSTGLMAEVVEDGRDGLHRSMTDYYDLIILDVKLPGIDGWHILRKMRQIDNYTPVMILSACGHVDDRIRGLDYGADDYLIKPFSFHELLARTRALLRRKESSIEPDVLRIGDLEIDLKRRCARRDDKQISLTSKEFSLLELLMRREGEVLSRSMIESQVWDMNFDADTNVVDVVVCRLRTKIGETENNMLIHTVRNMGYVLENRNK